MKKKILTAGLVVLFSTFNILAEPGGTYTLTGDEKGLSEIIKTDMALFPDLYKGESLNSYISKFKMENRIGKRKLSPGDVLRFPQTLASLKVKKDEAKQQAANVANGTVVLLNPLGEYKNEWWQQIQTSLEKVGYTVNVEKSGSPKAIKDHHAHVIIRIIQRSKAEDMNRENPGTGIHYYSNESQLLTESLQKEFSNRTNPDCCINKNHANQFLKQDAPSVLIVVSAEDAYKDSHRYAKAITDGITEFIEENPQQ